MAFCGGSSQDFAFVFCSPHQEAEGESSWRVVNEGVSVSLTFFRHTKSLIRRDGGDRDPWKRPEDKRLLSCWLSGRAIVVGVGVDVILTTGLRVGESGFLAEDIGVPRDCPEGGSGKSSRLSKPDRDESGTRLGKGARGVIDNGDSVGEGGKAGDPEEVDIGEWKVGRADQSLYISAKRTTARSATLAAWESVSLTELYWLYSPWLRQGLYSITAIAGIVVPVYDEGAIKILLNPAAAY